MIELMATDCQAMLLHPREGAAIDRCTAPLPLQPPAARGTEPHAGWCGCAWLVFASTGLDLGYP